MAKKTSHILIFFHFFSIHAKDVSSSGQTFDPDFPIL